MSDSALIVFARPPVAGHVKTRLTQLLTPQEAAQLYEAFLRDSLSQYAALDADVRLYLTRNHPLLFPLYGASLHVQGEGDLGQKMSSAFKQTLNLGYRQVVIIGSDHPTLPDEYLRAAFAALKPGPAITVGPSDDGGYYLLGMTHFFPKLFEGILYSRPDVMTSTLRQARLTGARIVQLPWWYDVDKPKDLHRLAHSTRLPPYTSKVMRRLVRNYGI